MIGLKTQCMHPTSNKPYIVRSSGGQDNSPEGAQVWYLVGVSDSF